MNDLGEYQTLFFLECDERLTNLEARILSIREENTDQETLNAIFREAHSIKGGSAAVGFDDIARFTHRLEAVLDRVRNGALPLHQPISALLLQAVDVVRHLVAAHQQGTPAAASFGDDVKTQLEALVTPAATAASSTPLPSADVASYTVYFQPHPEFFQAGNEPLLMLRELAHLGATSIDADIAEVPQLDDLFPTHCYLRWNITLPGTVDRGSIQEAFEFVEDICTVRIEAHAASTHTGATSPVEVAVGPAASFLQGGGKHAFQEPIVTSPTQRCPSDARVGTFLPPVVVAAPTASFLQGGGKPQEQEGVTTTFLSGNHSHDSGTTSGSQVVTGPRASLLQGGGKPQQQEPVTTSIRVDLQKIDRLMNMVGELVIAETMLRTQMTHLASETYLGLVGNIDLVAQHTRELQDAVLAVRMQPIKSVFSRLPRLVRDTATQLGKEIHLEICGESTEIDKSVIEQLIDPLTHMIRNACDHGIEPAAQRLAHGKPAHGTIYLSAYQRSGRVFIEVRDDGAGIARDQVMNKARNNGWVSPQTTLSDAEIDQLIFLPGFSTAAQVTDISGRGVGMDVVRRNIEAIGGTVELRNMPGEGTCFTISLPLTLIILEGMVARIGKEQYVIPAATILETLEIERSDIESSPEQGACICVRGARVPLLHLDQLFGVADAQCRHSETLIIALVESGTRRMAIAVDHLIGQQQVVIKSITANIRPIPGISGATILGDGTVSLILEISELADSTLAPSGVHAEAA